SLLHRGERGDKVLPLALACISNGQAQDSTGFERLTLESSHNPGAPHPTPQGGRWQEGGDHILALTCSGILPYLIIPQEATRSYLPHGPVVESRPRPFRHDYLGYRRWI